MKRRIRVIKKTKFGTFIHLVTISGKCWKLMINTANSYADICGGSVKLMPEYQSRDGFWLAAKFPPTLETPQVDLG